MRGNDHNYCGNHHHITAVWIVFKLGDRTPLKGTDRNHNHYRYQRCHRNHLEPVAHEDHQNQQKYTSRKGR